MKVATRKIDDLVPYQGNPRKNDSAVDRVADSIRRYGFRQPIVVDEAGVIIAGHTRWKAAKHLGLVRVPVHVAEGLSEAEIRSYRIADNATSEIATWDEELLPIELAELKELGADMDGLGFDAAQLERWTADGLKEGNTDPDECPDPPADPTTRLGDLWLLGRHRLLCGDSTDEASVARLLDGSTPFLMVTDPPYGVSLDQSWRDSALGTKALGKGNPATINGDSNADWSISWRLFSGDVAYVWHADKYSDTVMQSIRHAGFDIRQQIIWNKSVMVMGRNDYHFKHEPCWYAVRHGRSSKWIGDRKQTTVIDAASPKHIMSSSDEEATPHPTQKPVACMLRLMQNHAGECYDPFLGSGTTIIAAEQLGRPCFGMELDPAYCDVIVDRWEKFTGETAERRETA